MRRRRGPRGSVARSDNASDPDDFEEELTVDTILAWDPMDVDPKGSL